MVERYFQQRRMHTIPYFSKVQNTAVVANGYCGRPYGDLVWRRRGRVPTYPWIVNLDILDWDRGGRLTPNRRKLSG